MQRTASNIIRTSINLQRPLLCPAVIFPSTPILISSKCNIAGPSRPLSSTSVRLKKKGGAAKPAKGVVRSQDDPSETDVDVDGILEKMKGKMKKATDWANSVTYDGVERGRGRVSPALLDGIKVSIPNQDSASTLPSLASVTVKQNTLYVDCWDPSTTKHVESAIHKANLPGLSPQKIDEKTIKIPVSLPTSDQRKEILKNIHTTIESAKQQVRTARAEGLKLMGGNKAQGSDDIQELANEFGGELDKMLGTAKKELEK